MTDSREKRTRYLLGGLGAGAYVLLLALEVTTEGGEYNLVDLRTDALALLLTIVATVGVALLALRMQVQHEEHLSLIRDLDAARREGEAWRTKSKAHLDGVRHEMERQFEVWGLTTAEREVGLLILKGLNHREVATVRGTTEATARQQAQAIYAKANLPGKTAFSAYFLEDLWSPPNA